MAGGARRSPPHLDEKETDCLTGTPLLADYIEEGLSQLGYSLEDFEIGRM
jgi:hypothetical protein